MEVVRACCRPQSPSCTHAALTLLDAGLQQTQDGLARVRDATIIATVSMRRIPLLLFQAPATHSNVVVREPLQLHVILILWVEVTLNVVAVPEAISQYLTYQLLAFLQCLCGPLISMISILPEGMLICGRRTDHSVW